MVEMYNGSSYTQFVFGPGGKRFATMHGQTLVKALIPLPTGATAVYTSSGLTYYRHADHLGSSRLATTPSRTLYSSTAYSPYGEAYAQTGTSDLSFTGIGQDLKTGLYDFQDRENSSAQGRWLSPDPAGLAAVDPSNPQSWNRYAYVMNNPMAMIDPLGEDGCYDGWISDASCGGGGVAGLGCWKCDFGVGGLGGISGQAIAIMPNVPPWQQSSFYFTPGGQCQMYSLALTGSESGGGYEAGFCGPDGNAPLSGADQRRYQKLKAQALNDIANPECASFLESHNIPSDFFDAVASQQAYNGSRSTTSTAAAGVSFPNNASTIAGGFRQSGVLV